MQMHYLVCNTGILCGECKNGRGVSALMNYCVTCENASGILVIALGELLYLLPHFNVLLDTDCIILYSIFLSVPEVIADLVALVGLFLIKAPPPDFVYLCIFYIQVKYVSCMNTVVELVCFCCTKYLNCKFLLFVLCTLGEN